MTDGSDAGTHIVMNLAPDAGGILYSGSPQNMVVYNSKMYFTGNDQVHGNELFVSDGITIQLVKDVLPGTNSSQPVPIVFNGLMYIIYGQLSELWKSDGTAAGTQLVKAIAPYSKFAGIWNSKLYMTNNNDYSVWESDGTAAGTGLIKVQNTNNQIFSYGSDLTFTAFNGDLYFAGQCYMITSGYELVKLTLGGAAVTAFTFTGSGNWSNPANWAGGMIPPSTLPSGYSVVINGNCILDVAVVFQTGASLTVNAGKTLVILGSLTAL